MKLLILCLVPLFGICKAGLFNGDSENETKENQCMWHKMQQCMGNLLLSAPDLFWEGTSSVDIKTRNEFGDCIAEMISCTGFPTTTSRSQKQKDFCEGSEDCYDDDEEEDEDSHSKVGDFAGCIGKHKNLLFRDVADSALDVLGNVRHMFSIKSNIAIKTPNDIMCQIVKKFMLSVDRIAEEKCGDKDHLLFLMMGMTFKTISPYLYKLCSLDSMLIQTVLR